MNDDADRNTHFTLIINQMNQTDSTTTSKVIF